jgi:hypothetical protein
MFLVAIIHKLSDIRLGIKSHNTYKDHNLEWDNSGRNAFILDLLTVYSGHTPSSLPK